MKSNTRRTITWSALVLITFVITALSFKQPDYPTYPGDRINDTYRRSMVKSWEVFDSGIEYHALAMIRMKSGAQFPMLCLETTAGLEVIPQSVFATSTKDDWSIMCEPEVGDGYYLMMLEISKVDGNLFIGDTLLKPLPPTPLLP